MSADLQADTHTLESHHRLARGHSVWRHHSPVRVFVTLGSPRLP
jgi:hypothetical protein